MRAAAAHRGGKKLGVNLGHFNKLLGDKMFSSSPPPLPQPLIQLLYTGGKKKFVSLI